VIAKPNLEFGAVAPGETDAFLAVMCEAFEMDFKAAKPIFDADPYFEPGNKYVLRLDGEIVSCLTVVDCTCWMGDALLRVAGVAGVATRLPFRGRGLAGMLLTETVKALTARGFHIAALFPVIRDYYRRFGWETSGEQRRTCEMEVEPSALPNTCTVRKATQEDIPALSDIYNRYAHGRAMHCIRDEKRWRYLLTYVPGSYVARAASGAVEGYLLFDTQARRTETARGEGVPTAASILRVLEFIGESPAARYALRQCLRAHRSANAIEYTGLPEILDQNGFAVPEYTEASFMARILDWQGLLSTLAVNWHDVEGELALALIDPVFGTTPRTAVIRAGGGIVAVKQAVREEVTAGRRGIVVGDIHAWSAVAVGRIGANAAIETGTLKASSTQAADMVGRLFPAHSPFIPAPDHF